MSTFWERALGGQQPPPNVPQVGNSNPPGAWWQTPASPHLQPPTPPQGYQQPGSVTQESYQQLKAMRVEDMSQDMMEQLAGYELQDQKYNNHCPNCDSPDFIPAGTRIGSARMSNDKCFHCGSQGALTGSPEPAIGGSTGKAGRATRQTQAGSQGNYGHHISQLPQQYIPRS